MTLPPRLLWEPVVRRALEEDLGVAGDLTTDAIVPADRVVRGRVVARAAGRVAGLPVACAAFTLLDSRIVIEEHCAEGTDVRAGDTLAVVTGPARALLTGERTALNLLGRLCGIATVTASMVAAVDGCRAAITATRKTTPGLRSLERYAVRVGGGKDHRFGLDDAVLVKDNHVAIAGGVTPAVQRVREHAGHLVKVEVEVDTLDQLDEALACGVDVVLLDNMTLAELAAAVRRAEGRAITEASGGITAITARAIAETGVDLLSVGWLTHSAPALDVALDLELSR